mmetsp:Transcript_48608/g.139711  ORF Transcript_48608/g.139711 Transcript_48608/m.139711 type:complete len:345 (-) Transcript_48608:1049-2083(-)
MRPHELERPALLGSGGRRLHCVRRQRRPSEGRLLRARELRVEATLADDRRVEREQLVVATDAPDARATRGHQSRVRQGVAGVPLLIRRLVVVRAVEQQCGARPRPQWHGGGPDERARRAPGHRLLLLLARPGRDGLPAERGCVGDLAHGVGAPKGAAEVPGDLVHAAALHGLADKGVDAQGALVEEIRLEVAGEQLRKHPTMWVRLPDLSQDVPADVERCGVRVVQADRVEDARHGDRIAGHVIPKEGRVLRAVAEAELHAIAPGAKVAAKVHRAPGGRGEVLRGRPAHDPAVVRHHLRVLARALLRVGRQLQPAEVARRERVAAFAHRALPGLKTLIGNAAPQ